MDAFQPKPYRHILFRFHSAHLAPSVVASGKVMYNKELPCVYRKLLS